MTTTQSIDLSWDLPHPPAKVWRALTEPALLAQWLMPTETGPRGKGESFQFRTEPSQWWDGIVDCDVQELEPERRIRYSWRGGAGPNELDTVVEWTLTAMTFGTRLALVHSGFLPTQKFAFQGAGDGWKSKVDVLGTILAKASP